MSGFLPWFLAIVGWLALFAGMCVKPQRSWKATVWYAEGLAFMVLSCIVGYMRWH